MTIFPDSPKLDSPLFEANRPVPAAAPNPPDSFVKGDGAGSSSNVTLPHVARKPWAASDFESILPVQYYESVASTRIPSGERKLLFAILEDALRCYVQAKNSAPERAECRDARKWFNERGRSDVFSFESVCANLDIDPECLRKKLESLRPADFPRKQFHTRRREVERPSSAEKARRVTKSIIPSRAIDDSVLTRLDDAASASASSSN